MSSIKNCTVLVWNSLIDSYHPNSESAKQRAATIASQWRIHVDCGSDYPRPHLEVMSAAQYIKNQYTSDF